MNQSDRAEVDAFVCRWTQRERVFIPKAVGVALGNDLINSDNADYVIGKIRREYLADSTITVVLIGTGTQQQKIRRLGNQSISRQGDNYSPNGLPGILLPSAGAAAYLPPRFETNWNREQRDCYARYRNYPASAQELRQWLEDAFDARTNRAKFILNSAEMMKHNGLCKVHNVTHPA